jgi:hypothetical protein
MNFAEVAESIYRLSNDYSGINSCVISAYAVTRQAEENKIEKAGDLRPIRNPAQIHSIIESREFVELDKASMCTTELAKSHDANRSIRDLRHEVSGRCSWEGPRRLDR